MTTTRPPSYRHVPATFPSGAYVGLKAADALHGPRQGLLDAIQQQLWRASSARFSGRSGRMRIVRGR